MVAAKLANLGHGGDRRQEQGANLPLKDVSPAPAAVPVAQAASLLNVSDRSVKAARAVQRDAVPEVRKAVESGRVAVSAAAQVARLPQPEQRAVAPAQNATNSRTCNFMLACKSYQVFEPRLL